MDTTNEEQYREIETEINWEKWEELRESAVSRYLDKTDFDYSEWLNEEELKQYNKLHLEIYGVDND